jgi:hypothetical protein
MSGAPSAELVRGSFYRPITLLVRTAEHLAAPSRVRDKSRLTQHGDPVSGFH